MENVVGGRSDDTYKGFTSGTGHDAVYDYGGSADRIDLRPLESADVYFDSFDKSGDGIDDSLGIIVDDHTSVSVYGHFGPLPGTDHGNGRIEQIVLSDETIASAAEVRSLVRASSEEKEVAEASWEPPEAPAPSPLPAGAR